MIITAAKTVSLAKTEGKPVGSDIINETISETSITVMAKAKIMVPKGSPTLCATTSA